MIFALRIYALHFILPFIAQKLGIVNGVKRVFMRGQSATRYKDHNRMDKEKQLKIATLRLQSRKTHRIDRLRAAAGMKPDEFDEALSELAREQKIELLGGDTSAMSEEQIKALIKSEDTFFVNMIWLIPLPAKAQGRTSFGKKGK